MADKKWIQAAAKQMSKKGTTGSFTRQAKAAGYSSALAFARHVLANKTKYDTKTIRRAVFAVNANK